MKYAKAPAGSWQGLVFVCMFDFELYQYSITCEKLSNSSSKNASIFFMMTPLSPALPDVACYIAMSLPLCRGSVTHLFLLNTI